LRGSQEEGKAREPQNREELHVHKAKGELGRTLLRYQSHWTKVFKREGGSVVKERGMSEESHRIRDKRDREEKKSCLNGGRR